MSAGNKKNKKQGVKPATQVNVARPQPQKLRKEIGKIKLGQLHYILIACLLAVTFYCYHGTLNNEFTNWDDGLYVETDSYIKNLTPENIKMILFHNITNNYYHPLTMLTFAANYHFAKMSPHAYYLTDVSIFLMDVVMMFCLALTLLETINELGYGKIKGIPWLAAFCALFYGAHPMHVESVSWMAERKDIMYVFFYFLGMIMYTRYSMEQTAKRMGYVVICFILALASKPMAVFFPLTLFALDVLLKNDKGKQKLLEDGLTFAALIILTFGVFFLLLKMSLIGNLLIDVMVFAILIGVWLFFMNRAKKENISRLFIEKFPFFLICVASGLWSYHTADKAGSIASFQAFTIFQRLFFASHNFMMYFFKAFVPEHLCSYYPYPPVDNNGFMPIMFYISPLIDLAIFGIPLYLSYKAGEKYFRVVLFGLTYFFFNVVFILQIISAGPAIMADRYSDAAYFGIFFALTYFLFVLIDKKPNLKVPVITAVVVIGGTFAYLTQDRTKVWHNTETLWRDVIAKYPFRVETAYKNLGNYYAELGENKPGSPFMDSAYNNYMIMVGMQTRDAGVYSNIGNIYGLKKQFDKSLAAYSKAIALDSTNFDVYLDRAITYSMMGQYDNAITDYNHAYRIDPTSQKLLENRGFTLLSAKQYQKALDDYNHLIQIDPSVPIYYFNRGVAESNLGNAQAAMADFMKDLNADPKNGNCMYDISVVYQQMKDYANAVTWAQKAKQAGYPVSDAYIQGLQQNANTPKKD